MRSMSFSLTERQVLDGTKTVTRRVGWTFLKPGDRLRAVRKGMGLRKGEKQYILCVIEVVSVRREPLMYACHSGETAKEGFPEMSGVAFVNFFCDAMGSDPDDEVTRVEFRRVV